MKILNIIIAAIILFSLSCRNKEVAVQPEGKTRVRVAEVTESIISIPVHTSGILVSSEELKLSFKTGGIVAKIYVSEGARVSKGDLLATLDLSEINAGFEQAKSGYEKAIRDYSRAENLFRDSAATLEQKQNSATALRVAKSTLDIAQFNLTHSRITAPDDGVIMKQFVKENELASAGYPIFLFGTKGKYWKIKAGLADKDIIKVNAGDSALVLFDAYPGVKFASVVCQVGEMSNPNTGTYEIELMLPETDQRLISGFIAAVEIFPAANKPHTLIPVGSIVKANGHQGYIYVVTGINEAKEIEIYVETLIDSMAAVRGIPDGFSEIVSEGAAYLKDGMKVEVIK